MNYWFSSDWHLSHKALMKAYRPNFYSIEEMNEYIISHFYEKVKKGDQIYFLGDLSWDRQVAYEFLRNKPNNIHFHFIWGNHDKKIVQESFLKKYCASIDWIKDIKIENQKISLCHYMMNSWNCSHWNAWHIHGHHHNALHLLEDFGKSINVCIDHHNYEILNYEEIKEFMQNREDNWDLIKK